MPSKRRNRKQLWHKNHLTEGTWQLEPHSLLASGNGLSAQNFDSSNLTTLSRRKSIPRLILIGDQDRQAALPKTNQLDGGDDDEAGGNLLENFFRIYGDATGDGEST